MLDFSFEKRYTGSDIYCDEVLHINRQWELDDAI